MTILPPNPPRVDMGNFPYRLDGYTNSTPFTHRDGMTFLRKLESLQHWLAADLVPHIDTNIELYVNAFNKSLGDIQAYMEGQQVIIDDKVTDFITLAGKATSDFNAVVAAAKESIKGDKDAAEAAKTAAEKARDLSQTYAANTLAFQDETMRTLLSDPSNKTIAALNGAVISNFAESEVRLSRIPRRVMDNPPGQFYDFAVGLTTTTSIVNGGSGYSVGDIISVIGGTYKSPAQVRVSSVNGGAISGVTVYRRGAYKTPPTNPVVVSGGATANMTFDEIPTQFTEGTAGDIVPTNPNILFTGYSLTNVGNGGYGNPDQGVDLGRFLSWEWQSDAPRLEITLVSNNARHQLYINNQRVQTSWKTETNDGKQTITWMLDFGADRSNRVFRLASRGGLLKLIRYPRRTTLDLSGAVLDPPITFLKPEQPKNVIYGIGDSYMWGEGANEFSQTVFGIMAEQLGLLPQAEAITGAGWVNSRGGSAVARINATLAQISRDPSYIVWELGYNDRNTTDLPGIATAIDQAIARVKQLYPNVPQVMFGPATPLGETPALKAMKETMQARANAANIPFVDVANWVNASNAAIYTSIDNVHPTPLGHAYLGARKAAAFRALFPNLTV